MDVNLKAETTVQISQCFTSSNYNYLKCWFILAFNGKEVFKQIFEWGFAKPVTEIKQSLFCIPSYSATKYRKDFDLSQRKKIENGDLSNFDLNLFYLLLQRICSLPPISDRAWERGNINSLPSVLYTIKYKRNTMAHTNVELNENEMDNEINELLYLFNRALDLSGTHYSIQEVELIAFKEKINSHITSIKELKSQFSQDIIKSIAEEKANLAIYEAQNDLKRKYKYFTRISLTTLNLHNVFKSVDEVFCEPLIKRDKNDILYEQLTDDNCVIPINDILSYTFNDGSSPYSILIYSKSGIGKTVLMKYLIHSWTEKSGSMSALDDMHLIFYIDCRDILISSFEDFLSINLPNTSKIFSKKELKFQILTTRTLLLFDNIDDMNPCAKSLYEEITTCNAENFRIIASSCQSNIMLSNKLWNQKILKLQLEGIPETAYKAYVSRTLNMLLGDKSSDDELQELLIENILKVHLHSHDLMKSPEMLNSLIIQGINSRLTNDIFATKTQMQFNLYDILFKRIFSKLKSQNPGVAIEEALLKKRLSDFFNELFSLAFCLMSNSVIELSYGDVKNMLKVCEKCRLPYWVLNEVISIKENVIKIPLKMAAKLSFSCTSVHLFYCALYVVDNFILQNQMDQLFLNVNFIENMRKNNKYFNFNKYVVGVLTLTNIDQLESNIEKFVIYIFKNFLYKQTHECLDLIEESKLNTVVMDVIIKFMGNVWAIEDEAISPVLDAMLQRYPPKKIFFTLTTNPKDNNAIFKILKTCVSISNINVCLQIYYNFWLHESDVCDIYLLALSGTNTDIVLESFAGKLSSDCIKNIPHTIKKLALQINPTQIPLLSNHLDFLDHLSLLYINLNVNLCFPLNKITRLNLPRLNILLYVDIWNIDTDHIEWVCDLVRIFSLAYSRLALRKSSLNFNDIILFLEGLRKRRVHVDSLIIGSFIPISRYEKDKLSKAAASFECLEFKLLQL